MHVFGYGGQRRSGCGGRFIIAAIIAIISLVSYYRSTQTNPVTGEKQHVSISPDQEIGLGLQAAPEMAAQFGGLDPDPRKQALVDEIGAELVRNSDAARSPYRYDFHLLADDRTLNAFALPGGQIFITDGLFNKLHDRGELAGVLGHEIGHVVGRHAAEHMAKAQLTQGLTGAAVIASYDPNNPSSYRNAAFAALIGQMINMKFSRSDESEADVLGVKLMSEAGYDPRSLVGVMNVLKEAAGAGRTPEFFSTHPNPENRIENIKATIQKSFPNGVPEGMKR